MKVAIIHYWLVNMRGGEKMLESLLEIFPDAVIYTHVYNPACISEKIKTKKIITSRINALPFAYKLYKIYMPLMPAALLDFDLSDYELIISSEAGPAKGVIPPVNAYHLCYCHTPMRYAWDMYHTYYKEAGFFKRFFMRLLIPNLRIWDITSANLVDRFVTNSNYVAKRIMRYYRRQAEVVYGPCDIDRFIRIERNPKDFYLFFGQITENKGLHIAINACQKLQRKLVIAGGGAEKKLLGQYKNSALISFAGSVSDAQAELLFSQSLALLFPGIEDMGLIPIEANAAGCPVIALKKGGVLDTIDEGLTGMFFEDETPESLAEAIQKFENSNFFTERSVFTNHVRKFSKEAFKERILRIIEEKRRI